MSECDGCAPQNFLQKNKSSEEKRILELFKMERQAQDSHYNSLLDHSHICISIYLTNQLSSRVTALKLVVPGLNISMVICSGNSILALSSVSPSINFMLKRD